MKERRWKVKIKLTGDKNERREATHTIFHYRTARPEISVPIWRDPESKLVGGRRARREMRGATKRTALSLCLMLLFYASTSTDPARNSQHRTSMF